ncbi:uncharacterized protein LOC126748378 [Anthonomus grandis grandis]|uniref:uncharacterized protein LOC126748378 n=1 Tax=Anthonomus grandis grandis TaxID=2921223 RepID=UPI0021651EEB|nr:uncharacterized protein LOC126748378 [Anthonomus grandis grandis]XP_050313526.1 uncharacterized protein LOC126748378 [Anthonomus grandis grandis]XP_050313527.1 uncharacterized protein LOC126748378 [Anthonomus grandis grandis]
MDVNLLEFNYEEASIILNQLIDTLSDEGKQELLNMKVTIDDIDVLPFEDDEEDERETMDLRTIANQLLTEPNPMATLAETSIRYLRHPDTYIWLRPPADANKPPSPDPFGLPTPPPPPLFSSKASQNSARARAAAIQKKQARVRKIALLALEFADVTDGIKPIKDRNQNKEPFEPPEEPVFHPRLHEGCKEYKGSVDKFRGTPTS